MLSCELFRGNVGFFMIQQLVTEKFLILISAKFTISAEFYITIES